jgi:hypothetical protein
MPDKDPSMEEYLHMNIRIDRYIFHVIRIKELKNKKKVISGLLNSCSFNEIGDLGNI